jgi:hypothetical protein
MRGWHWAIGLMLLLGAVALGIGACTSPPTFSDTANFYLTFNPVYIDSLPNTGRAFQTFGGYNADGFVVLYVTRAEYDALPRLWAYQLWALSGSGGNITNKASTPKWLWDPVRHVAVGPDGNLIEPRKFNFGADITTFDEIVLTIEPYPDYYYIMASGTDTAEVVVVDDDVFTGSASPALEFLRVGSLSSSRTQYEMRFPTAAELDSASGFFFLANYTGGVGVPSSVANAANFGLWFGYTDIGRDIFDSLLLPPPPTNWVYQGWVEPPPPNPAQPITTGRFVASNVRDSSDAYSGDLSDAFTLSLPGEDFLQNEPNVAWSFPMNMVSPAGDTGWAYITLEPSYPPFAGLDPDDPSPDINEGPFFYRVLQSRLPDSTDTLNLPELDPNNPDANRFELTNMHGTLPRFGHAGAPLIQVVLSSQ